MEKEELSINLEQDLNEIASLIWGYMDKKYIGQLKEKLSGYRQECEGDLCKEAQLMRAMIPFMPAQKHTLEFLVEAIIYNDIIERSLKEHNEMAVLYRDDNKDREQIKKLVYKLILFKIITIVEKVDIGAK